LAIEDFFFFIARKIDTLLYLDYYRINKSHGFFTHVLVYVDL